MQGVKLHAVVDACHSGSAFDLPYHSTVHGGQAHWQSEYRYQTRAHKVWWGSGGGVGSGFLYERQCVQGCSAYVYMGCFAACAFAAFGPLHYCWDKLGEGEHLKQYAWAVLVCVQGTAGGFCVQFGASKDSQVAADTAALSGV